MPKRRSSPFLYRLFALAAAAVLPLLGLLGWQIAGDHRQAEQDALEAVRGHAATMSHEVTSTLARAQQLMLFLAQRPEVRAIDRPRCTPLLEGLVELDAVYADVSLFDAGGAPVCSATRTGNARETVSGQDWFKQVREGAEFGFGRGASPGQRPALSLSHGMRDEHGALLGVLRVSLDLVRWADSWGHLTLPADSVIALQDADFRLISRYPDAQRWIGQDVRAIAESFHRRYPDGAGRSSGLQGVSRYFATQAMQPQGWQIVVGIPAAPLEDQARTRLLEGLLAALAISLATLGAAWLTAKHLAAPLGRLAATARSVAAGRLDARADVDASDEFRDVAVEFNRMLDARALAELRADRVARFYAALSQTNQAILRHGDSAALLSEICEICVAAGHAKLAIIGLLDEQGILRQVASSNPEIGPHFAGMDRPFDLHRPEDADTWVGRTLREGEHQVANDFQSQASTPEWREVAREEGIGAMACFPIRRSGQVNGVLTLYTAEADFFDRALVELLDEMAKDLSYALDSREAAAAQASAEAASQAKTEFLSRIGHELRTPLNAVLGFAQMLGESGTALSPAQAAQVEHIRAAGWHLLALIDDILDVAAVESGRLRVERVPVDVAAEIEAALALCKLPAEQAGVRLGAHLPAGPRIFARCDAVRLRQALINLLTNAVKYNRRGGQASLSLRATAAAPRRVIIEIRDNGHGMSAEQLERLFEPFNRLGRESGPIKGLGIGLALTRQLVELMGGSIEVSSVVDAGTRVVMSLPLAEEAPPAAARSAPATPAQAASGTGLSGLSGRLLYVEDNEINVLVLSQFLSRWPDLQLEIAVDGRGGLTRAAELQPDLLLLDMHLPDMDGYQLLHELRARPETAALRVVVLSASAMPEEVARARAAGALDYWTKPLDLARLERELRALLVPAG